MVTIKEIARQAGVSAATVSRVLTGNRPVQPHISEQVLKMAEQLGYVPNTAARALVTRRTYSIGIVVNNLHDPFFHDLIRGFEAGSVDTEYNVVFCSAMGRDAQRKHRYVRYLSNGVVDGIVLYGSYFYDEPLVRELQQINFPFSLVESRVEGLQTNSFLIDNRQAVKEAVLYLYRHGHRKIACIAGQQEKSAWVERVQGYRAGMEELSLPLPEEYCRFISTGVQDGRPQMQALLDLPADIRPTALVCHSDEVASHAIRCILANGLRVPQDISVVGFDNQAVLPDNYSGPAITSIFQPLYDIGYDSIVMMESYLNDKAKKVQTKIYPTHIVEKETVANCIEMRE